jgi:hypothetical protein
MLDLGNVENRLTFVKLPWFDGLEILVLVTKLNHFGSAVWSSISSQSTEPGKNGDGIPVGSLVGLANRSHPLLHNSIRGADRWWR